MSEGRPGGRSLAIINHQKRHVQGQAELAALSAALRFQGASNVSAFQVATNALPLSSIQHIQLGNSVEQIAEIEQALSEKEGWHADMYGSAAKTVLQTQRYQMLGFTPANIKLGILTEAGFAPLAQSDDATSANALRVDLTTNARLFLLSLFLDDTDLVVERSAIVRFQRPRVSFALSNCLLNVRLLEPILRPILGARLDVLCSGRGIDARIEVASFLTDLAIDANLLTPSGSPLTYGDVLNASVPVSTVFSNLFGQIESAPNARVSLSDVIYLSPDLAALDVGSPLSNVSINAADLAFATAEILGSRILDLGIGLSLGPVANVRASVRISDPRQVVIGAIPGDPNAVARTSQIALDIAEIDILGIFGLKLDIRVANASARLSRDTDPCGRVPSQVVAIFDPVDASLIDIAFGVRVLGLPDGQAALGIEVDTMRDRSTRRITFTRQEYLDNPVKTILPSGMQSDTTVASALRTGTAQILENRRRAIDEARPSCSGLIGCVLGGTLRLLNNLLSSIVGTLTTTVANVLNALGAEGTLTNAILNDLLGIGIARANLELLHVQCGGVPQLAASGTPSVMPVRSE